MLSRTSEYALRALIYLANHMNDWPIPGNAIATNANIPSKYLSSVLSELVRRGVLESARGKSGGFRMVKSPKKTKLMEVLCPFEQFENRRCPFGNEICSDANPCAAHHEWSKVVAAEQNFLTNTSVQDIAVQKRRTKTNKRRRYLRA